MPKPTEEEERKNPYTEMPDDFIPLINKLKPTKEDPTPLMDRYLHLKSLDKRLDLEVRGQQFSGIDMEKFQSRLSALRQAVVKWGSARVEAYFVHEMNKKFPDLKVNGRKLESSSDFVELIKIGPWDNALRGIVAYASSDMWGDNNQFAINLEIEFTEVVRIKYTGLKSNGKPPAKIHRGKCCAQIFVKNKGTLVGKIRNACKRRYCEAVYSRKEDCKIASESAPDFKDGVPKLIAQIPATVESMGFHGKLGICVGSKRNVPGIVAHPSTSDLSPVSQLTGTTSEMSQSSSEKPNAMDQWLEQNKGKFENPEHLLAHLLADQALKTNVQTPAKKTNEVPQVQTDHPVVASPPAKKRSAETELVRSNLQFNVD